MWELFLFGSFWFWALVALEIIVLFLSIENEKGILATISLIMFGCILQFMGDIDFFQFACDRPLSLAAILASYFVIGSVWGVAKWWIYCLGRLEQYNELKAEFLEENGFDSSVKTVPKELRSRWNDVVTNENSYIGGRKRNLKHTPLARENKAAILRWMSFWPISMIWSLINDFVKNIFKVIYRKISGFLQRIADNMFESIKDDFD